MDLLLDTHVFIWAVSEPAKLSSEAHAVLSDGRSRVFVSAVIPWEITIKKALGKLDVPDSSFVEQMEVHRFKPLPIEIEHALAVENLPPIHRDPFDRMLIAQAQANDLILVTHDQKIVDYPVKTIRA